MLRIEGLTAGYGLAPVIAGLDLTVPAGEVVAVLGRNGSGKSTLVKAIIGILPDVAGSIRLGDTELVGLPAHRIARLGAAYVPQGRGIFPRLTVHENLLTGTRAQRAAPAIDESVFTYFPVLRERLDQLGGTMSGGEQQMLALARALCGRPRVLLLDEPSDGIAPKVVDLMAEIIPGMARDLDLAIILVEQNVDLALAVAQRCAVMERGVIVHAGPPAALEDPAVLQRYLAI